MRLFFREEIGVWRRDPYCVVGLGLFTLNEPLSREPWYRTLVLGKLLLEWRNMCCEDKQCQAVALCITTDAIY